ncbi:hypothetical protein GCM10027091_41490 [Streptomyces daliensis]
MAQPSVRSGQLIVHTTAEGGTGRPLPPSAVVVGHRAPRDVVRSVQRTRSSVAVLANASHFAGPGVSRFAAVSPAALCSSLATTSVTATGTVPRMSGLVRRATDAKVPCRSRQVIRSTGPWPSSSSRRNRPVGGLPLSPSSSVVNVSVRSSVRFSEPGRCARSVPRYSRVVPSTLRRCPWKTPVPPSPSNAITASAPLSDRQASSAIPEGSPRSSRTVNDPLCRHRPPIRTSVS